MDYSIDTLFDDASPAPATSPQQSAEPASSPAPQKSTAQPSGGGFNLDDLYSDEPAAPAAKAPEGESKDTGGFFKGLERGAFQGGVQQNLSSVADAAEMLAVSGDYAGAQKVSDYLKGVKENLDKKGGKDMELQVPSVTDILGSGIGDTLSRLKTYTGEQLGMGLGSSAPSLAAGIGVGALTSETGPGAIVAGLGAAGVVSYLQNAPQVYRGLIDAGMTDKKAAVKYALLAGAPMAALDTIGEKLPILRGLGVEGMQTVKRAIYKRIVQDAAKTAASEGITETAQQVIQDATTSLAAGKDFWTKENIVGWADNFAGGAIGGAGAGGIAGVRADHVKAPVGGEEDKSQANPTVSEGGTPAADHLGAGNGQSSPGGTGTPAPMPKPTVEDTTTTPAAQTPPSPAEGKVDADQAAAMQDDEGEDDEVQPTADETDTGEASPAPSVQAKPTVSDDQQAALDALSSAEPAIVAQTPGKRARKESVDEMIASVQQASQQALQAEAAKKAAATTPQIGAPTGELTPQTEPVQAVQPAVSPQTEPVQEAQPATTPAAAPVQNAAPAENLVGLQTKPDVTTATVPEGNPVETTPTEAQQAPAPSEALAEGAVEEPPVTASTPEPEVSSTPAAEEISIDDLAPDEAVAPTPAPAAQPEVAPRATKLGASSKMAEAAAKRGAGERGIKVTPTPIGEAPSTTRVGERDRASVVRDLIRPEALNHVRAELGDEHDTKTASDIVDKAVAAHADEINSSQHGSPAAALRALREPILAKARELAKAHVENVIADTAAQHVSDMEASRAAEKERKQIRATTSKDTGEKVKPAEGVVKESERSWQRRHAEQAPTNARSAEITRLYGRLGELAGGNQRGRQKIADRKIVRDQLDAYRAEDIAAAEKAVAPEPTPEEVAAKREQEIQDQIKAAARAQDEVERAKTNEEKALDAKYAAKNADHDRKLAATLKAHPEPSLGKMAGAKQLTVLRDRAVQIITNLKAKVGELPKKLAISNSMAQNFLIQAKRLMPASGKLSDMTNDHVIDLIGLTAEMEHAESPRAFYDQLDKAEKDFGFNRQYDEEVDTGPEPADLTEAAEEIDAGNRLKQVDLSYDTELAARSKNRNVQFNEHGLYENGRETVVNKEDIHRAGDLLDSFTNSSSDPNIRWTGPTRRMNNRGGLFHQMQKILDRRLKKILGSVPVYIIDDAQMKHLAGHPDNHPATIMGYWIEPTTAARAQGAKGAVVINRVAFHTGGTAAMTLRHELIHGLTEYSIRNNVDGIRDFGSKLLERLRYDLLLEGNDHLYTNPGHPEFQYGLTNVSEFFAEAFSNPAFQEFLASRELSPTLRRAMGDYKLKAKAPSYWDAVVQAVSKLLRMTGFGGNGNSYMEAVMRLGEPTLRGGGAYVQSHALSAVERLGQDPNTKYIVQKPQSPTQIHTPDGLKAAGQASWSSVGLEHMNPARQIFGSGMAAQATTNAYEATAGLLDRPGIGSWARQQTNKILTMAQIAQNTEKYLGRDNNPFHDLLDTIRGKGYATKELMQQGDGIVAAFQSLPQHMRDRTAGLIHDATLHNVDPSQGLSGPNNAKIGKGILRALKRAQWRKQSARFAQLTPKEQQVFRDTGAFYKKMQNDMVHETVNTMIVEANRALPSGMPPPAGKTIADQVDFVKNGGIERMGTVREMPGDAAMYASIKPLQAVLKQASSLRSVDGFYSPLMRRGDYAVKAKRKLQIPAGAARWSDNQFIFRNKAAFQTWADDNEDHLARQPQTIWLAKDANGRWEKSNSKEADAVRHYIVTPQLDYFERFDKLKDAKARSKELAADDNYTESSPPIYPHSWMKNATMDILPSSTRAIVEGGTRHIQDPVVREMVRKNLVSTIMQQNVGTRIQQRQFKRRGVHGYSKDAARAMADYNVSASNQITKLRARPAITKARADIEETIRARQGRVYAREQDDSNMRLAEAAKAIDDQLRSNEVYDPGSPGMKWIQTGLTTSFLNHLFSPANWVVNGLQTGVVTTPYLAARHGGWRTMQALGRAYRVIGSGQQLKLGAKNTLRPLRPYETIKPMQDTLRRAGLDTEAEVIQRLMEVDLISKDAGMELESSEIRKSAFEKGLSRTAAVASAMPKSMENINRATAGLAAYWLSRQDGATHEQGINAAKDAVNDTHGDYSNAIAPLAFKSPGARLVLQFKKYPQMMMRLIVNSAIQSFKGLTHQERVIARKQLIGLTLTHALVAGAGGVPFMEAIKMLALLAHGIGGGDDYEGWENWVQGWMSSFLGDKASEVVMHGLPRLAGADLAGRMGADSLLFFGSPRDNQQGKLDQEGVKSWLFDTLAGAPLGVISSIMSGLSNIVQGDVTKGLQQFPLPKVLDDTWKAGNAYMGPNTKASGVPDIPSQLSLTEAVYKALGFQPARLAERYEYGGDKYKLNQYHAGIQERTEVMGRWLNAANPSARKTQWQAIQAWNKGQPPANRISYEGLLKAEQRRKATAGKEKKIVSAPNK